MIQKQSKLGFSMAEMLIAVALIGILASILVPLLNQFKPNKNKTMFRKAYQETERIVYELINDKELYGDGDGVFGFDNVAVARYNGATYGDNNSQVSNAAKCKFMYLFASKLNTLSQEPNCSGGPDAGFTGWVDGQDAPDTVSFTTTDGIFWSLPKTNFTSVGTADSIPAHKRVIIDINGNKPPNKMDSQFSQRCADDVDRFSLFILANGKIDVSGACAKEYVKHVVLSENTLPSPPPMLSDVVYVDAQDGPGHVSASSVIDDSGAEYFDGDIGNCDPTKIYTNPTGSGCL